MPQPPQHTHTFKLKYENHEMEGTLDMSGERVKIGYFDGGHTMDTQDAKYLLDICERLFAMKTLLGECSKFEVKKVGQ